MVFEASAQPGRTAAEVDAPPLAPRVITEPVYQDADDPAIWIHPDDPSQSLIIGTDKDEGGALFIYDLDGNIVRTVPGLRRPNYVDVAYGFDLHGTPTDVAVTTERYANCLRIFRLPDMEALDDGGIEVFVGEQERAPMGVGLYTRSSDNALFAIVSRKSGPLENYLWQYRLGVDDRGVIRAKMVRAFGAFSGKEEIEAIAVDDEPGYVYYSDETVGVRKYHADPDAPDAPNQLALFATEAFEGDHEGIAIFKSDEGAGYIIVSDQQRPSELHFFPREGSVDNRHEHRLLKVVRVSALSTDGIDATSTMLNPTFSGGMVVAMSNDRTFHLYSWDDIVRAKPVWLPDRIEP